MRLYKLVNSDNKTRNNTTWEVGKANKLPVKDNPRLRSGDVLHAYKSINLGLLLNSLLNQHL